MYAATVAATTATITTTRPTIKSQFDNTIPFNVFGDTTTGSLQGFCACVAQVRQSCLSLIIHGDSIASKQRKDGNNNLWQDADRFNSEIGRLIYTISILLMFAFVILMLMIRSIRRSSSTLEVETLLESMRFREDLDLQQRQRRRLKKAKQKVTAWLSKTNEKMWASNPQIILPKSTQQSHFRLKQTNRASSLQSGCSYLPEIIISNIDDAAGNNAGIRRFPERQNSCTPSLSLIYDFEISAKKQSLTDATEGSEADLSQFSDLSYHSTHSADYDIMETHGRRATAAFEYDTTSVILLENNHASHRLHNDYNEYYNDDNYIVGEYDMGVNTTLPLPQPRKLRSVSVVAAAHARVVQQTQRGAQLMNTTNLSVNPTTNNSSELLFEGVTIS